MKKFSTVIKSRRYEVLGLLGILVVLASIMLSPRGAHITRQFFDPIRTTENRDDVVIVGIDDKSLQEIGAWPWSRRTFADLTTALNGYKAKAIVYDVLFLEPREGDGSFSRALDETTIPVILGSKLEKGNYLKSFLASSTNSLVTSLLVNVEPDVDGKVRTYPTPYSAQGVCTLGLGEGVFRIVTFSKDSSCNSKSLSFRYPESIATYSLSDVIAGRVAESSLKNKVVFIGSVSLDLEDHFVSLSGEKVPGVYVHASILSSLLQGEGDTRSSPVSSLLFLIFSITLTLLALYLFKSFAGQAEALVFLLVLVFVLAYASFSLHYEIPAPWMLLSILVTGGYVTLYRFISERKKSEYIQSLFSKYVHKDVLEELLKHPESLYLEGEKRDVTVLFSDLRGFTTLSESMSPEELTRILNAYLSAMSKPILEEKGTIDKYIGDAVMAFWNAPLLVSHHQSHAVMAALSMHDALALFNKERGTWLAMGVGIHTGDVIVGNVGGQERLNYTILGDTVNLASRVEGLTKKYGVDTIVTEDVKNKTTSTGVLFRKLDVITVKGKTEPTTLYEAARFDAHKEELAKEYKDGFSFYQAKEFDKAKEIFEKLAAKGDGPSKMMCERLPVVQADPSFDGIWRFDEK